MYKITIEHLEKIKKALENSNKFLDNLPASCGSFEKEDRKKAVAQNEKTIKLINNEYLNIPS